MANTIFDNSLLCPSYFGKGLLDIFTSCSKDFALQKYITHNVSSISQNNKFQSALMQK